VSAPWFPPSLAEACADAERRAPREAISLFWLGPDGAWHFESLTNRAAGETSFEVDPLEWMALERRAAPRVCFIHSHVDGLPALSARDEAAFTVEGRPVLPGLSLVVLALRQGRVFAVTGYVFTSGWRRVELFDSF
jgi:proteasome lid subunit RPN8/RPN11